MSRVLQFLLVGENEGMKGQHVLTYRQVCRGWGRVGEGWCVGVGVREGEWGGRVTQEDLEQDVACIRFVEYLDWKNWATADYRS